MHSRPASLALRVNAFVGITLLIALFVFGWVIHRSIEHHFVEQDTGELSVILGAIEKALDKPSGSLQERLANAVTGHHEVYFAVTNFTGDMLYKSGGPDLGSLARNQSSYDLPQTWQDGDEVYRVAVRQYGDYIIVAAFSMRFHMEFMSEFRTTLGITLLLTGLVTICAAGFAVNRGHLPLHRLSQDIRGITSENLDVRLEPNQVPVELQELVTSFNSMLAKIEDTFERLSNFSADLAHEFRTPITNLTTQTQVALSNLRTSDEYREILYSSLEEYERLSRMIGDMLLLARTESGLFPIERSDVDLRFVVDGLFEYFDAWAEEQQVNLCCNDEGVHVDADRLMIRQALSNLVSNAVKHADEGSDVRVALGYKSDQVQIAVTNTGSPIEETDRSRLFDRFYRADPSRQHKGDGAGLGLAIVKSIVDAHGGSVRAESSNGLTRFTLLLPRMIR